MLYGRKSGRALAAWIVISLAGAESGLAQSGDSKPYGVAPFLVPAKGEVRLEAENFDKGEEGAAYHDNDPANAGKQFRPTDGVDIGLCNDNDGGYRIGWITPGEWVKYTVRVSTAGRYNVSLRVSSRASSGSVAGKLHIEDATGANLSGEVSVPGTGDAWQDVRTGVTLQQGDQTLKLVFDSGGYNLNYLTFSFAGSDAAPAAPVAQPATPTQSQTDVVVVATEEQPVATTSRLGAFAEEGTIGDAPKGQTTVAASGTYGLRGGAKLGGKADGVYFISNKVSGDGEIVAKVDALDGTGAAGVMYRESADADARFAAVMVTANSGAVFQRRAEKGGSALSATVMGAKPPVWLRLVRSGSNFSAFYSAASQTPGEGDWKPIGSSKPVAMAAEAMAGLASTNDGQAVFSSVAAGVDSTAAAAPVQEPVGTAAAPASDGQLTGKVIGTEGSYNNSGETRDKAFDDNLGTCFDPPDGMDTRAWVGLDLGGPKRITRIAYCPRSTFASRMVNGVFQGSNSPTFAAGVVDLYTVTTQPPEGQMTTVDIRPSGAYRYVRYTGGTQFMNVAEIKFYGETGPSTGVQLPGTGAAVSGRVADIEGKNFDLTLRTLDWVHWTKPGETNRKQGVTARIGELSGERQGFNDNHVRYSWTDGTPQRRIENTTEAVWTGGTFEFSVRPGDTRTHTLVVYVGGVDSQGEFTATVPGAAPYVDRGRGNLSAHYYFAYTLQVRVARPTDEIRIQWKQAAGSGNIQIHGAALY